MISCQAVDFINLALRFGSSVLYVSISHYCSSTIACPKVEASARASLTEKDNKFKARHLRKLASLSTSSAAAGAVGDEECAASFWTICGVLGNSVELSLAFASACGGASDAEYPARSACPSLLTGSPTMSADLLLLTASLAAILHSGQRLSILRRKAQGWVQCDYTTRHTVMLHNIGFGDRMDKKFARMLEQNSSAELYL